MIYRPFALEDIDILTPYLAYQEFGTCDYTLGGMMMWRDFFRMEYCLSEGALLSRLRGTDGVLYYNLPLAPDWRSALSRLVGSLEGAPIAFCTVPEAALPELLVRLPGAEVLPQEEFFDYRYLCRDLAELSGKRYAGQRNLVRQFQRAHGSWSYRAIDGETLPAVIDFFERSCPPLEGQGFQQEENRKVAEVLRHFEEYGFFGGVLFADGIPCGFSLGERLGDTIYVHIEKAERGVKGAYQMLVNQFALNFGGNATYLNREEDMGDAGLRESKRSYHPSDILKKYVVRMGS